MQRLLQHSVRHVHRRLPLHSRFYSVSGTIAQGVHTSITLDNQSKSISGSDAFDTGTPITNPPSRSPTRKRSKRNLKPSKSVDAEQDGSVVQEKAENFFENAFQKVDDEPDLADLERYKPKRIPKSNSPEYIGRYTDLLHRLCRTFSKDQLRRFCAMYKMASTLRKRGRKKDDYAKSIIENQWGWESLEEIDKRKKDKTEVVVKTFGVTPSELFLFLGKDGKDLHDLTTEYNVNVNVNANPLALKVEGLRGAVREVEELILSKRKRMVKEIINIPTTVEPFKPALLQHLSGLANAYITSVENDAKLQIKAVGDRDLDSAKRLLERAFEHIDHSSVIPLLTALPAEVESSTSSYALFPFSSDNSPHWIAPPRQTFRLRRVGDWTREYSNHSDAFSNIKDSAGNSLDLEDFLNNVVRNLSQASPTATTTLSATVGHMVYGDIYPHEKSSILPPIPGRWNFSKLFETLQEEKIPKNFIASMPPSLEKVESHASSTYRLSYRSIPEVTSKDKDDVESIPLSSRIRTKVVTVEADLLYDGTMGTISCKSGEEANLLILQPDRPMDLKLTARNVSELSTDKIDGSLKIYLAALRESLISEDSPRPRPPITINVNGLSYVLEGSDNVRRKEEVVEALLGELDLDIEQEQEWLRIQTRTENRLDLETNLNSAIFEILSPNDQGTIDVAGFFKFCNAISTMSYISKRQTWKADLD